MKNIITMSTAALAVTLILTSCGHNAVVYGDAVGVEVGFVPEQFQFALNFRYGKTFTAVVKEKTEVPLAPEAVEVIKSREGMGSRYVFELKNGRNIQSCDKSWASACRALGIVDCHKHDLRHTGATWALRSGADITTVSASLGHASVSFTARVYAHVMTESKLEAARGAIAAMTGKMNNK